MVHAADDLWTLQRDEALPRLGLVDVGGGARLAFDLAVGLTLADLARFKAWERTGRRVEPERWSQLGADLLRLHRMATSAPHDSSSA
jgi:hypothetical protein